VTTPTYPPMTDEWAVVVTLPLDHPNAPEGVDLVRRVGPLARRETADDYARALSWQLSGSAPEGTTVTVEPYDQAHEHLDPRPPADLFGLAGLVEAEPDGPGGGWGFPDLYSRLRAAHGDQRASQAWMVACRMLDSQAEAEQLEAEAAERDESERRAAVERLLPHLARVERAAKQRARVYTVPVLNRAAQMLAGMIDTAARFDVTSDDLDAVTSLPSACVDSVSAAVDRTARAVRGPAAETLLELVRRALEPVMPATVARYCLTLDRPPALAGARGPLVVRLIPGDGWTLTFDRPGGMIPIALISAGLAEVDANAVAEVVNRVHRGELGDPFSGRR
jgi:hypothetical protein